MRKKLFSGSPYLKEFKKKKIGIFKKRLLVLFAFSFITFVGLALLFRWSKLNIKNIEVSGNTVVDSTVIEDAVKKEIAGNYLFVFPKANFLIYPKSGIKNKLTSEFKILKDISISLKGVNTLAVSFSERMGKYTWCGNDLPILTNAIEKCDFMDDSGYIFGAAPYFSGDVYFKFYGVVSKNSDSPLGSYFFPDIFSKLLSFQDSVKNMGVKTSSYFVKPDGSVELYLFSNIPFPDKPKIVFNSDADMEKMAENLQTALTTEPLQTDFVKKYSSLLSIDLRYGNKVYYKFSAQGGSASGGK